MTLPVWLDVTEKAAGDFRGELPMRPDAERTISAEALVTADAYATRLKSLSLLVWRAAAIEFETYRDGRGPDDVSETYSMAKSMLGLAIGSVDDAVARYLRVWRGTAKETLTIRQRLLAALERATGQRYADFVSARHWKPLGARDATLWLDRPKGTPRAFSYFVARPRDWLRLGVMIAGQGRFNERNF